MFLVDSIAGIRNIHQFDADKNGSIACRRTSLSNDLTIHMFKIKDTIQPTINQVWTFSDFNNEIFLVIEHEDVFRLAQVQSSDPTTSQITVTCFDPPFPASLFSTSKSPRFCNLIISSEVVRASLFDNPEKMLNSNIRVKTQQLQDINIIWEEE